MGKLYHFELIAIDETVFKITCAFSLILYSLLNNCFISNKYIFCWCKGCNFVLFMLITWNKYQFYIYSLIYTDRVLQLHFDIWPTHLKQYSKGKNNKYTILWYIRWHLFKANEDSWQIIVLLCFVMNDKYLPVIYVPVCSFETTQLKGNVDNVSERMKSDVTALCLIWMTLHAFI